MTPARIELAPSCPKSGIVTVLLTVGPILTPAEPQSRFGDKLLEI